MSKGVIYTADPAPLVDGETMYIIAGHDEAPRDVATFVMSEWVLLATDDPASGNWKVYPHFLRPETLFAWAAPGAAWAAQIVRGPDKRFYLYAPVKQRGCAAGDCMGIGVAAADTPLGPWRDIHPQGPIASQSVPDRNDSVNIDPTVWVDSDGRAYLYWGTFGRLHGVELARDMKSFVGAPVTITTLRGFFEAPWLFKRNGAYYLVYAANNAGPDSPCTKAVYHACQAYGVAPTPLGPWTYKGVILDPVSSTTSHAGIAELKGKWYMAYHTADAAGGGHFRRSVAIDRVEWDDSVSPAAIKRVIQTRPPIDATPTRNVALLAHPFASNVPIPLQYRLGALNDDKVSPAPLPPDMWSNWTGRNDAPRASLFYRWDAPVTIDGSRIYFWNDHAARAREGVAPPKSWRLDYWNGRDWQAIRPKAGYPVSMNAFSDVSFKPVKTSCLRAVLDASGGDPAASAAMAVEEWQVLSPNRVRRPAVQPDQADSETCTAPAAAAAMNPVQTAGRGDYAARIVTAPPPWLHLDSFYRKYADALGIPITSSRRVPDEALLLARDIVVEMLADRPDLRRALIAHHSRVAIMAVDEGTTDLPEQRDWKKPAMDDPRLTFCERKHYGDRIGRLTDQQYWNRRARGMGGALTSAAAENLLGIPKKRYYGENIFVHEFSHNILAGIREADQPLYQRIERAYASAMARGLWKGEYGAGALDEYWAEGTQFWFNSNKLAVVDGRRILSDTDLAAYDPGLYNVLSEVYPGSHRLSGDVFYLSSARVPPGPPPVSTAEVC